MRRLVWLLALGLAVPAIAQEKDRKGKKDKRVAEQPAITGRDLVKEAEEKIAAGDKDGAVDLLRKAATQAGGSGEASLRLGRLLESKFDFDLAIDAYKAAGERLTGSAKGEALGRLALLQELRGMAETTSSAESAIAVDPEGVWPTIAVARARARERKGDEAVALAEKAAAAGGGGAAAVALGYAEESRGELAAAEAAYRGVVNDPEHRTGASLGLSRVLRKTGRAAEAEGILKTIIEQAPGAVEAYKESARVKMALGRASEAMGDAATAAAMGEGDAEAQRLVQEVTVAKALELVAANQLDLAIQDLTRLRDQYPDLALARVGLARAFIAKRQAEAALEELQKALALEPTLAEAHYRIGYVHHMLKRDAASALPFYEKAASADPTNIEYRTQLGAVLVAQNHLDRAVAELTTVTVSPGYDRAEAWIYLGAAQVGAKRYSDAIAALNRAATLAPDNVQVETFLAWSYFGLKDAANFVAHGKKAKSLGQKDPNLLDRLARVEKGEPIK